VPAWRGGTAMAERATDERDLRYEEPIEISNEFALVNVRKVHTPNGERLEIEAPRRSTLIRLDPLELETIACNFDERMLGPDFAGSNDDQRGTENEKEEG
jgi:hypothetical protein